MPKEKYIIYLTIPNAPINIDGGAVMTLDNVLYKMTYIIVSGWLLEGYGKILAQRFIKSVLFIKGLNLEYRVPSKVI